MIGYHAQATCIRPMVCPQQCGWPKVGVIWQKLHAAANEARERVRRFYALADEIDANASLSGEDKYRRRGEVADEAIADFEASNTLMRARDAVRGDGSPDRLNALKQAEAGWQRAMNKIAERSCRTKGPKAQR